MPSIANALASDRNRAERQYLNLMHNFVSQIKTKTQGLESPDAVISAVNNYFASPGTQAQFRLAATKMATMLNVGQYNTWREAASASSRGRDIYRTLSKELKGPIGTAVAKHVEENSHLISTVGQITAKRLSNMAAEGWQTGKRPEQIAKEMAQEASSLTKSQIRRIARTESAKASTALVEARAEALGLEWYIWQSAEDERVRESHQAMNDVLCRWDDPPDPEALNGEKSYGSYPPGGIFNCRCIALPVIQLKDIDFPAKVYDSGNIIGIGSLKEFMERFYPGEEIDEPEEEPPEEPLEEPIITPPSPIAPATITPTPTTIQEPTATQPIPTLSISNPDTISDVLGIIKGQPVSIEYALKNTNPNYSLGKEYRINCQRCVPAYELQRRGYKVEALPKPANGNNVRLGTSSFDLSQTDIHVETTKKKLLSALAKEPDGARFVIQHGWKRGGNVGHTYTAEKIKGKVYFLDPQNGDTNAERYLDDASWKSKLWGGVTWARIDNKPLKMSLDWSKIVKGV